MKIDLSDRMQTIADMVIEGKPAADIGTDHGYIPAYLLMTGKCPKVILTDIAEGPLERASKTLKKYDLDGELRLDAGLDVISPQEVSTVIIAGMGGETIMDILGKDPEKSHSFKRIILQPRTFIGELRVWLLENGFSFTDYALCRERKLINEVMAVEPKKDQKSHPENELLVSSFLLKKQDPLLPEYLKKRLENKKDILSQLERSKSDTKDLEAKVRNDIGVLEELLSKAAI